MNRNKGEAMNNSRPIYIHRTYHIQDPSVAVYFKTNNPRACSRMVMKKLSAKGDPRYGVFDSVPLSDIAFECFRYHKALPWRISPTTDEIEML